MNPPTNSLKTLPYDERDLALGAFVALPTDLPDEFSLSERPVKNQDQYVRGSDNCTAYATGLASEFQEKTELFSEYTFAYSKVLTGDVDSWGQNLRSACKAQQKMGAIEIKDMESVSIEPEGLRYFNSYPVSFKKLANKHRKKTYVKLNSFNEIVATLWKYQDRAVVMGIIWAWGMSDYMLTGTQDSGFGHAVCAVGFKTVGGQKYLEIQNSYGTQAGKNGRHLLSEETVNHFVKRYGAFCFIDMPTDTARVLQRRSIYFSSPWWRKLFLRHIT